MQPVPATVRQCSDNSDDCCAPLLRLGVNRQCRCGAPANRPSGGSASGRSHGGQRVRVRPQPGGCLHPRACGRRPARLSGGGPLRPLRPAGRGPSCQRCGRQAAVTVSDLSGSVFRLVVSTAAYRRTELCPQFCRRSRAWFIVERGEGRAVVSNVHKCESNWKTPYSESSSTRYRYKRGSERATEEVYLLTQAHSQRPMQAIHSLRITLAGAVKPSE